MVKLTDTDTLLSYMSNSAEVDPAAEALYLDAPGEEKLYALASRSHGSAASLAAL